MLVSGNEKRIVMIYYDITKLYMHGRERCTHDLNVLDGSYKQGKQAVSRKERRDLTN